jgi:hypothetical protein
MNGRLALNERERSEPLIRQTGRLALNERERSERLIRQTFVRRVRCVRPHFVVFATVGTEIGGNLVILGAKSILWHLLRSRWRTDCQAARSARG